MAILIEFQEGIPSPVELYQWAFGALFIRVACWKLEYFVLLPFSAIDKDDQAFKISIDSIQDIVVILLDLARSLLMILA